MHYTSPPFRVYLPLEIMGLESTEVPSQPGESKSIKGPEKNVTPGMAFADFSPHALFGGRLSIVVLVAILSTTQDAFEYHSTVFLEVISQTRPGQTFLRTRAVFPSVTVH